MMRLLLGLFLTKSGYGNPSKQRNTYIRLFLILMFTEFPRIRLVPPVSVIAAASQVTHTPIFPTTYMEMKMSTNSACVDDHFLTYKYCFMIFRISKKMRTNS